MSAFWRAALIGTIVLLILVGVFTREDGREFTATSFGETPFGYRASFELLERLSRPVRRNFSDPAALPPGTLWLIAPPRLCGTSSISLTALEYDEEGSIAQWVRRGGTLVLFLDARGNDSCRAIGDLELPLLAALQCTPNEPGDAVPGTDKTRSMRLEGDLVSQPRRVEVDGLRTFAPDSGWDVRLSAGGAPFVLEHAMGGGRIVAVADAQVLRNQRLDRLDASVLVVDLASELGDPWYDEWLHGFREHESLPLYLVTSPALPVLCGVLLLGLAVAWFGSVVPARTPQPRSLPPSLDGSVRALAAAYAATGDCAALHAQYRHYAARRLRHHLGLAPDAPAEQVADRLARRRLVPRERVRDLFESEPVRKRSELLHQIRNLDQLIAEARK